jgi:hypothetical protein
VLRVLHTAVAARYTDDRRTNFDIYLPEWLARYNRQIFGPCFVAALQSSRLAGLAATHDAGGGL